VRVCRAGRSFECTLAELHAKFKAWAPGYSTKIRSLCDGVFRLNDIVDVLDKGIKPVLEVRLASGKKLKATGDHEIMTSRGFVALGKIKHGAIVITNGAPRCRRCGAKKNVVVDPAKKYAGFCRACIYGGLRKNGRARPAGEVRDKDGYVRIGGHKGHPRANRHGQVLEHILVVEKRIGRHLSVDESVHHIDHVKHNNVDSNLKLTTKSAHSRLHGLEGGFRRLHGSVSAKGGLVIFEPKEDRVVDVRIVGEAHVYDVVCAEPHRNFVANGIVVHNCGKSAQAVRALRAFRKKTVIVCLSQAVGVWAGNDYMESQVEKWWPLVKREGSMMKLAGTSLPVHEWRVWRQEKKGWVKLQGGTVAKTATYLHELRASQHSGCLNEGLEFRCACGASKPFTVSLKGVPEWPSDAGCSLGVPRPSTRVVVVHLDILHAWADFLINVWGATTLIVDEIHEIQSGNARRTVALKELANGCDVRIGLTGTPMPNKPKDLWQTFDILSPGRYGEKFFLHGMRYCAGHQVQVTMEKVVYKWDGRNHEKELHRRLRYSMLRRTKAQVQKYLPPKIREVVDVAIPAKACLNVDLSVLKRSSVARQALALSADAKLPFVLEALRAQARAGDKVIVFTHRKLIAEHIADSIRASGLAAGFVNGDVAQKDRDRRIADCKNAEGGYILACTFATCSTGIDFSFANRGAYVELPYEPHVLLQSEDRMHRHGQQNTVVLTYYIGRGSIDDLIAQAIILKLDTFDTVIGNTGNTLGRDLNSMPKGRAALDALYETLRSQP
jgi:hypothetical protein